MNCCNVRINQFKALIVGMRPQRLEAGGGGPCSRFIAEVDRWRLARRGVLLLRCCLSIERLTLLRAEAQRVFTERRGQDTAHEALSEEERRGKTRQMSMLQLEALTIAGAPAIAAVTTPRMHALADAYLGHEAVVEPRSYVRRMVPGAGIQSLPFHQDEAVLLRPLINVWVPLDPCGVDAPGLELVRTACRTLREPVGDPEDAIAAERVRLDEFAVQDAFGGKAFWHPPLKPGDALIFAGTTIHRSYVTPAMTQARLSVEVRFT